jgi:hypothetical protein
MEQIEVSDIQLSSWRAVLLGIIHTNSNWAVQMGVKCCNVSVVEMLLIFRIRVNVTLYFNYAVNG